MERGSTKHNPREDDELAQETQGLTQGAGAGGRAEEWRVAEPAADGEPEPGWAPQGYQDMRAGDETDADRRDFRARIGSYLTRAVYPADRDDIVTAASEANAPDDVLDALSGLPDGRRYENARELWDGLGLGIDQRF